MEKKQKTEMNQKEYGHFPNLTDKTSQEKEKKKKGSVWHAKVIYRSLFLVNKAT